jgi:adenosine deaminase
VAFEVTDAIDRDTKLWRMLKALPKIELHRHLEGAIRIETLVDVAIQYDIPLPSYDPEFLRPYVQVTRDDEASSRQFLTKFSFLRQLFVSEEVIRRIAQECVEDAAADNIRYMELRFTPYAQAKLMGFAIDDVVNWISEATVEAARQHDIKVNLIIAMNRHESVEIGAEMLSAGLKFRERGIVGADLCGNEVGFPAEPFVPIFEEARAAGLGITIHGGEWAGHENVRHAIEHIQTERVGHGVRAVEDSETLQLSIDSNVYFEVCPTSNLQTGVTRTLEQHPLIDLHFLKANVTINTDDPSIHNITLTDEYALLAQGLHLPLAYLKTCVLNAVHCAFLPRDEKTLLLEEIEPELQKLDPLVPETKL